MAEPVTSTRRAFLDSGPVKRDNSNKENNLPVLSLIQFSKSPFVTFGTIKLGTSKSAVLRIENPTEDAEAEVTIEKVPSSKGFSVDHSTFMIQPEGSYTLTITWTPSEEGGVRELVIFSANGVLKHQAILLGRAEAPKKKKKSLWDTIKNKQGGEAVAVPRKKKPEPPLKMAANRTFQVSRKQQYKRSKPRSPLASLNEGKAVRDRSLTKQSPANEHPWKTQDHVLLNTKHGPKALVMSDQENIHHAQRNSPIVISVPDSRIRDSSNTSASPDVLAAKPENKDLSKVLNITLSPIGTPERFKRFMPHILSESPVPAITEPDDADSVLSRTPVPSLKDALALINSDLSHLNSSPPDTSSSCDFSDSLESKNRSHGCGSDKDVVKVLPDSPELSGSNEPRLTFFVSKKVSLEPESDKASFTSATVTKGKAPVEVNSSSGRKIKKSRRRLLEKTLELTDGSSQCESGRGTPSLPVIHQDIGAKEWQNSEASSSLCDDGYQVLNFMSSSPTPQLSGSPTPVSFPITSPPSTAPTTYFFPCMYPPPAVPDLIAFIPPSPSLPASPPHLNVPSNSNAHEQAQAASAPLHVQEDSFPIHVAVNGKKRKSEEFPKKDAGTEGVRKTDTAKRSRVVAVKVEPTTSAQQRRSVSQRRQLRPAASLRSKTSSLLKSTKPALTKQPSSKTASRGAPSLKSSVASSVKVAKVVAVAQSKLTFVTPAQTAIPRHPMPFAAKNMFYDERWIEKQERGFTWWINYILTPDDFKVNTEVAKVNAVSLAMGSADQFTVPKAPTKEEMSFSTYTARRKLNRLRRSACQLFTSEAMVKAIQRLELEVEAKRLLVRKDRHLWKDIGERRKVLNWLLSYNPLWLRIGLETIYGELISLESNSDALGLAMFILQRLLWNPDIAAEFRHPKVPHLYKEGHEEALSRFTLKKLLLLVCFLDRAKESRLIEHDPCLFCVDAEFKTSKDLLLAFSRDFLSGEGILPRHLGYLGLPVSHVQTPLDEFSFAVKNLAVDLKCGIRLVRVMELLVQDWSLSLKLRLPAISRLQKVHNVDIALQVLKGKGVDLKDEHGSVVDSRDIVDGHREKTLSLLWKIIFAFHVEVILDKDQLMDEIGFLKKTLQTKRRLFSLRADRGLQPSPAKTPSPYDHSSTKITLLMDWVRAVCDFYNLKVENFTVAFSDGRVLCHLIHHYHPGLLPEEAVRHSTTQTVECSPRGRLQLNCSASDSDSSFDSSQTGLNGDDSPSVEFKQLLENEKNNFRLVNTAVAFLGGVPAMINPADMSNTIPNEKVVMSYLSFLCARLLDLRNETRAARVIQGAWRKYRLKKDLQLYKERNMAAMKIQALVRRFLQRRRARRQDQAAVSIQAVWRGYAARTRLRLHKEAKRLALQHRAASVIQAQWRMFSDMRAYQRLRCYTIVVQARWRMKAAAAAYGRICWAAAVIQKRARARTLARREREQYLRVRTAAVKLQRGCRRWRGRKTARENRAARVIQVTVKKWYQRKTARRAAAAVKIQSWYRMQRCLGRYRKLQRSAALLQAQCRGHVQRRRLQALRLRHRAATVIQSAVRGHAVRKQAAAARRAALHIQRRFRASVRRDAERQRFVRIRRAAVAIQAAHRGKVARELLNKQHKAATVIQAAFRRYAARSRYLVLRGAAAAIQQKYRATRLAREARKDYDALRKAALVLQASWRGRAHRRRMEDQRRCATAIQAHYRRRKAQTEYRAIKAAAAVLQRRYRAHAAGEETRRTYLQTRAACVTLQAGFRGTRVRMELKKRQLAATVLQSSVRMFLCRKQYVLLQSAAIVIQSRYRALLLGRARRNEYRELKRAARKVQAAYRGFRVREDLRKRDNGARIIQAWFRMHRVRMAYLATKCAAIIVQERFRAKRLRDGQLQSYKSMKSATVTIQAAYRGHRARTRIAEMHRAATVIQRRFLATRDRSRFLAIKEAALVCQQRYRARRKRLDYLSKRNAAICLQAAYRAHKVRKQLHIQHKAALTIQTRYRRYRHRTTYNRLRWAAVVLQRRYRANKKMEEDMRTLNAKRRAAVVFQAAFRGMKSRRILKQQHQAASVIQRAYRTHSEHGRHLALKASVLTVQRRYRATAAAKRQMHKYQQTCRAAVVLQAAFRGQKVRREVARRHQAATVIQAAFRKHREFMNFRAMRLAAVIIQRYYRGLVLQRRGRQHFVRLRQSAVVLQAAVRGHRVRAGIAQMHRAATAIQANYKRHRQQSAFRRQLRAAGVLQQRLRAQRQRNVALKRYQEVRAAAITLQAAFRGMESRRILKQQHQAASVIQRAYRTHCEHQRYLTIRTSVLYIQRKYRATLAAKQQMANYQKIHSAAVVLQAAYRGRQVRKSIARRHQAATVIQAAFRKHREFMNFRAMRLAAVIIQRYYRGLVLQRRGRQHFVRLRQSAVVLQAAVRGHRVRAGIAQMHRAATAIQANYKRHRQQSAFRRQLRAAGVLQQRLRAQRQRNVALKHYQEVRAAAITLQAAFRGMESRRMLKQQHQAASVIQRAYRVYSQRKQHLKVRSSVLAMQRRYRAAVAAKAQRREFLEVRRQAVVLQAACRGWHVRTDIRRQSLAAVVLQSCWRCSVQRRSFLETREAAVRLQQRVRAVQLGRVERNRYTRRRQAVLTLQKHCRAWTARRRLLEAARAESRLRFTSAVLHHLNAIKIQRALRAHWALESAKRQIHSVITVQRWVRARQQRRRYLEDRRKVVRVQRAIKLWLARRHEAAAVIQRATRRFLLLKCQKRIQQGIVKAQALWRGHCSRRLNDNPRVVKLRRRLRQVSADVRDEDRLCNKTSSALDYLLRYKQFSYILEALKNLDSATRLSPECCVRLVESGATNVIFTLVRCCNRSVPCMDVITFSIQILLNLSKYHKTIDAVFSVENCVETLLDLLQRYREKAGDKVAERGGSIFTKACFLLALLLQDKRRAVDVMKIPKVSDRIRSIYRLTARKHKMDAERTVTRQKMNASLNGSFFVQATPRKSRPALKFAPDWVLRKDKLQDVVDPLRAIQMVADTLSVVL